MSALPVGYIHLGIILSANHLALPVVSYLTDGHYTLPGVVHFALLATSTAIISKC